MSHGATTTQNMAFATTNNSRPFNTLGNSTVTDKKSMNGSLHTTFGGRGNAWGSSSIWSNGGLSNGLTSGAATRDNSVSRDTKQQLARTPTEEIEGKTGSGSLVDSSVSEDYAGMSSWGAKRSAASGRPVPNARYTDSSVSQQRSVSNAGLPTSFSGANQNLLPFGSRPPTINLNSTASAQPRQSFGSALAGGLAGRNSEQPPFNVYTKFDRPTGPIDHGKKPDSAVGSWAESTTTPSPSDERRLQFPMQLNRTASLPTSRDGSLPPSRHTNEPPMFTQPDYSRSSQRATPNSSRAPSISSTRNGLYNGYTNGNVDQMMSQFGQLGVNSESRPGTSYRRSQGANGYTGATISSSLRPTYHTTEFGFDQRDDIEEIDRAGMNYLGLDQYPSHQATNFSGYSGSFAERYLQAGKTYEFRPGQPYTGGSVNARSYDMPGTPRATDWQNLSNGALTMSRRSPGLPEPQQFLDPRMQQMMAAQLRNPYAAMYNPYAMSTAMQLSSVPQYMPLLPMPMPSIDSPVGQREAPIAEGVQSALMYEFKSNTKTKRYELRDIYDHIAEFSGDQHGSRFIQTKLETANSDEKERVFREIQPNAIPLMTDVFGNYVIQKFFEHGDQTHKKILANKMRGQVLQLSLQMYGCRVVQKALDHVLVDQQASLISELENHVLKCVKDQNGNHVIQKAIERCPAADIGFIIAAFQGQVQQLSIHPYGCRVIQRCLEKRDLPSKGMIMMELMEGIHTMISDQFGNYVVQHIVSHDQGEPKRQVLDIVLRGLEGYSKHKFASNVVEKCVERSDDSWRLQVVNILVHGAHRQGGGEAPMVGLIKDNFGNYVIQKLLDTLCFEDYKIFHMNLQPAVAYAKRTGCGKQVVAIEKKMHRFDGYRDNVAAAIGATYGQGGFQLPLPLPTTPFASNFNSAATTPPPPLTADTQSLQSSAIPSVNGDTVEGATVSRKGSEQQSVEPYFQQHSHQR